jgi:hypothetical protein
MSLFFQNQPHLSHGFRPYLVLSNQQYSKE